LRYDDWVEANRAYVDKASHGRIGYIHLSDMGSDGLSEFGWQYPPQYRKEGLIIDVRYNGGGSVAEMILSHLLRKPWAVGRFGGYGMVAPIPTSAFLGHMAAVCNGETGSDGETFTEGMKALNLGPVIGERTWGGWVGIRADKPLNDRGMVTLPEFPGWSLDGKWLIEGWGTNPDVTIVQDPTSVLTGKDPQLDYTINYLLKKIADEPRKYPQHPPYPDRSIK
jgi:tricorn protease